jgi:hypothetical protein
MLDIWAWGISDLGAKDSGWHVDFGDIDKNPRSDLAAIVCFFVVFEPWGDISTLEAMSWKGDKIRLSCLLSHHWSSLLESAIALATGRVLTAVNFGGFLEPSFFEITNCRNVRIGWGLKIWHLPLISFRTKVKELGIQWKVKILFKWWCSSSMRPQMMIEVCPLVEARVKIGLVGRR